MAAQNMMDMLNTIRAQLPALVEFVTGAMYLVGFALVLKGVYTLKQYGEMRSMMSMNASLKAPLLYILSGTMLIFYLSSVNLGLTTIYDSTSITAYSTDADKSSTSNNIIEDLGLILRLIGYISFFRGWIILTHLGNQQSPPGTLGRALTHIIGGILLVNIFQTWQIIKNSIGYG